MAVVDERLGLEGVVEAFVTLAGDSRCCWLGCNVDDAGHAEEKWEKQHEIKTIAVMSL